MESLLHPSESWLLPKIEERIVNKRESMSGMAFPKKKEKRVKRKGSEGTPYPSFLQELPF
jgi:hypothetical protein